MNQQEVDECSGEMMKGERHKIEILKKKGKTDPFHLAQVMEYDGWQLRSPFHTCRGQKRPDNSDDISLTKASIERKMREKCQSGPNGQISVKHF